MPTIHFLMATGGPNAGTGKCMACLGPNPQTDMCPETAVYFVQTADPFGKWIIGTIVCTTHREEVRTTTTYQNDFAVHPEVVTLPPGL